QHPRSHRDHDRNRRRGLRGRHRPRRLEPRRGTAAEPRREFRLDRGGLACPERSAHRLSRDHTLTLGDAEAIGRERLIKRMTPNVDGNAHVVYGNRNWHTHWRGIDVSYFDIKQWDVSSGAHFLENDVISARSLVLIGETVREQLFGDEDPVGQVIRINEQLFQVVGVLLRKGPSASGSDQDDTLILPWTTAQMKLRGRNAAWLDDILCSAVSQEAVNPAIDEITALLRQRHHIQPGQEDDFNIRRPDEIIKAQIETSHTLEVLLVSIASIALVVGGIGVMNVMLVSVTERT